MTEEIKEMFGKMLEDFSEVRRQHQEMMSWRTEVNRRLTEPAAHRDNNEDESMHDQDDEDLGWADRLTGTQTQASQPGAASLVASPPPSGPDCKTGKGAVAIQGSPTNTHSQAAQDRSEAVQHADNDQQIMKWAAWGVNRNAKWYHRWNKEKCWGLTVEKTSKDRKSVV